MKKLSNVWGGYETNYDICGGYETKNEWNTFKKSSVCS